MTLQKVSTFSVAIQLGKTIIHPPTPNIDMEAWRKLSRKSKGQARALIGQNDTSDEEGSCQQ